MQTSPNSTVRQIAEATHLKLTSIRYALRRNAIFACGGVYYDLKGRHGVAKWFVREHLLTDTPTCGWLSTAGRLHACARREHISHAKMLHPGGERALEKLGWIKLQEKEFFYIMIEGSIAQAQINRITEYYDKTGNEDEMTNFMFWVKRHEP